MKTNFISYSDAVKMFNNHLIMCNNIAELDPTIWENVQFNLFDEYDDPIDIYQYYLTDCSATDVEYLSNWYGLKFTYSEMLDCYVLCVDHWGTSWSGVMIEDKSPRF